MFVVKILSPFLFTFMRIVSVIIYLLTILSAFGGRINPDYLTFPSLLCLAMPYFAMLTILLIIFWALTRKIILCAAGIFTIIICLTPLSAAFPMGSGRMQTPGRESFRIMSWNVLHTWDIRDKGYPENRTVEFMLNSDVDIICLAELMDWDKDLTNVPPALKDSLFTKYPYREGKPYAGIKVLSKYPVKRLDKIRIDRKGECRYDFFKFEFPGNQELIVAMVHLYSYGLSESERMVVTEINSVETAKKSVEEFKGSIRQKLRNAFRERAEDAQDLRTDLNEIPENTPLIVCGDFNDVPASWTYNIIRGEDMRDAYSETNFGPAITYNLHAFYFHIDQMLYRGDIEAIKVKVDKINSSDHYPLIGEFEFDNIKP